MHGSSGRFLRLCFIVLFGAMSVFHFPVMAFGGDPHSAQRAAQHHAHHSAGHADPAKPAGTATCDGYACLLAVEPALIAGRPLQEILFGVLRLTPTEFRLTAAARPEPPPPRLQA